MKKIFALALVLVFATVVSSFAGATGAPVSTNAGKSLYGAVSGTASATNGALIGKMSNGVYPGWMVAVSGYTITTQHQSGTKSFGSSHDATAIYRNDTKETAAPDAASYTYFASNNWTAM